jgi:uncharacterized membrane protein
VSEASSETRRDLPPEAPAEVPVVAVMPTGAGTASPSSAARKRIGFSDDFRRFFVRGLAALLPTLITISLLAWLWNFLWTTIGQHVIFAIRYVWYQLVQTGVVEPTSAGNIRHRLNDDDLSVRLLGVLLAILLVYLVGMMVGNLIGRWFYRVAERAVMAIPLIRAIYPAVKQVTDFILADKKAAQFAGSRVVAVQARAQGIWSIGFVTGAGYGPINDATKGDMITVFIPSTPTAFAGYVVVAHREATVELPLTVEETMRLLVSGGVIVPHSKQGRGKGGAGKALPKDEETGEAVQGLPTEILPAGATFVSSPQELARLTGRQPSQAPSEPRA